MEPTTQTADGAAGLARERKQDHWILSAVEGLDGDLVQMLFSGLSFAEIALLTVAGPNVFVWEDLAFALAFLLEAQGCPREFLS